MAVNAFGAIELALEVGLNWVLINQVQAFDNERGFVFVLTTTPPSSNPDSSTNLNNLIAQKNPEVHTFYASSQPDASALFTWRKFCEFTNGEVVNAAQTQQYTYQVFFQEEH